MTQLWTDIRTEINRQVSSFRPFIGYAGPRVGGLIRLRRVQEVTAGLEKYASLAGFIPNEDEESIWISIGGKPVCLGPLRRTDKPGILVGSGAPEGVTAAPVGSLYLRSDGGTQSTLYVKESGSGNTGWVAIGELPEEEPTTELDYTYKAINANAGAATASTVGMPDVLLNATTSTADGASGSFIQHATSATITSATSMRSDPIDSAFRRDWQPEIEFIVGTRGTISSMRMWIGVFDGLPNASSDPTLNGAAFRYATDVDGTAFWRCWSNDNSGGGQVTTTSVAVTASTVYRFRIKCTASEVEFYINGNLVATHSSNLPTASAMMGYNVSVSTLTNASRAFAWSRISIRHKP